MALIRVRPLGDDTFMGCWRIEETSADLLQRWPHLECIVKNYHNEEFRREKLCVYALLYAMTGEEDLMVGHDAAGKPLLDGWHVSLTDTRGFVAVILSRNHDVGVDIEFMSHRVERIVSRFIREDEQQDTLEEMLVNWSAKETTYKYFSADNLQYFDMRLRPFIPERNGYVEVENLKRNDTAISVGYEVNDEYVLTWTTGREPD